MISRVTRAYPWLIAFIPTLNYAANNPDQYGMGNLAFLLAVTTAGCAVLYAAVVEFIHTATLVHDDIIDDSTLRRGRPAVHSRWGNDITVLPFGPSDIICCFDQSCNLSCPSCRNRTPTRCCSARSLLAIRSRMSASS